MGYPGLEGETLRLRSGQALGRPTVDMVSDYFFRGPAARTASGASNWRKFFSKRAARSAACTLAIWASGESLRTPRSTAQRGHLHFRRRLLFRFHLRNTVASRQNAVCSLSPTAICFA